ncbi:MAG: radical SAM protein [Thermodesulfovibrionales bacterium]
MNSEQNIGRGAGYVAGSIREAGHALFFYDSYYDTAEQISRKVAAEQYDVLMISSMTILFEAALKLISLVKSAKDIPVLVGGIHVTIFGAQILSDNPQIDYCCVGEGESMVKDFLNNFKTRSFGGVPNLLYREAGEIISNPVRDPEDLSKLPPFPWDLFRKEQIVTGDGFLHVNSTRGCPFNCTYCCNSIYLKLYRGKYLRMRPPEDVLDEIRYLKKKYDPGLIYFADEMMLFNAAYVQELLGRFKNEIRSSFGLMARVEYLTEDTVKYLAECGCTYVAIGVECGDEEFSKNVLNRNISNQDIEVCVNLLKRYKIFVTTYNMIGYPVAYDDTLTLKTVAFIDKIKPDFAQISIFYPFPGTRLYDKCIEEDLIDFEKAKSLRRYYGSSVLKGREYISAIWDILVKYYGMNSKIEWYFLSRRKKAITISARLLRMLKLNLNKLGT